MMSAGSENLSGFRFPAEWEPQAAVWFAWPTRTDLWAGVLPRVLHQLAALYVLAAKYQPVRVLCPGYAQEALSARMAALGDSTRVELYDYECDDVWCRDFGPLFMVNESRAAFAMTDWRYNAWGNKFPRQAKDNAANAWIAEKFGVERAAIDYVLEGGAIESNGAGQLLTTEVVLLNPNRNGPTDTQAVESVLGQHLGVKDVLWLKDGLLGDDTDGHIDNLARFFKCDGILMASTRDAGDGNYSVLKENLERAKAFRTLQGTSFEIVELPIPDPVNNLEGEPLAASYLNFLVLNGAVLVPTYGQAENDAKALEIISACYPERAVVGFDCSDIIYEGGAIHCMSQNQPLVKFRLFSEENFRIGLISGNQAHLQFCIGMEKWLSGRKRFFAKEVNLKRVPGVRIPSSPPFIC